MAKSRLTYASSGVSIKANDTLVNALQRTIRQTQSPAVLANEGGFAGFFRLFADGTRYRDPVLVGCADGVGTKVLLAKKANKLSTVGIDLVAMNVNDMITCGARPLFFLDYVAVNKNVPSKTATIVKGVAKGCVEAGCTLLGGETAEMPDVYQRGDFDLAGFAVGVVEKDKLINGKRIRPGDVILGLSSSGIHSNGYSLARKLFFETHNYRLSSRVPGLRGTLGNALLRPTRIYVKPILSLLAKRPQVLCGAAHITGGGLPGNVPRVLPPQCHAHIDCGAWKAPAIFRVMSSLGITDKEMYDVFNMGIGMILVVRAKDRTAVCNHFKRERIACQPIGEIKRGKRGVSLIGFKEH